MSSTIKEYIDIHVLCATFLDEMDLLIFSYPNAVDSIY